MDSLSSFVGLSFEESDDGGDVVLVVISDLTKGTTVTFQDLTLLSFNEAELHVTIDCLTAVRRADGRKESPLFGGAQSQTDNLARASKSARSKIEIIIWSSKLLLPVEKLDLILIFVVNVDDIDGSAGNKTEFVGIEPFPEDDGFVDFDGLELLLRL